MAKTLYVVEGTNGKADRLRPVSTGPDKPFTPPPPDPVGFLPTWGMPAFQDEFDTFDPRTPSGVNPDKWRIRDGETQGNNIGFDTARPQNVFVDAANSCLNIVAIRESGVTSVNGVAQPAAFPWTTGYIDTIGKDAAKYGRWDIRAKLNTHTTETLGIWPALWGRPSLAAGETADGEIDDMEAWGGPWAGTSVTNGDRYRRGSAQVTVHQNELKGHLTASGWLTPADNSPDLSADFHVYTREWTPTGLKFYVDSVLRKTVDAATTTWLTASLNAKFHYRIQLQVGQTYWGMPDPNQPQLTKSPSDPFQVDWIRRYNYPG
jgi:beta-glucanase (GH16 family)